MHLPQFQYRPMDLSKDSIRLVRLCHGSRGPVECELFEGFLDDSHRIEYEALSYTWGGLEKEAEILVNGCSYRVTANLFKALVHLRDRNRDRVLWIDAICIDQDNHKERGHQVAQMKLIYEKSDEVIVWLGESSPDADLAMEFLSRLDKEVASNGAVWRRLSKIDWQSEIKIGFRDFLETIQPNQLHQIKSALEQLFRRPWFTRAWIIQEIASARRAIILCGYWSVRSRAMAIAPSVMKLSIPEHVRAILQVFPGLQRQDSWWNSGQRSLRTLLAKFRRSEATLQRDKVFALLGIATDACEVIHPDYEKSDQEICEQVASFFAFGKITSEPILRTSTWDPGSVHFRFDALIQHILEKPM
ncbi:heterokaryon incompatibility protein-domain-containing protein, partial [Cladorrhinum sp. PSN332]